MHRQRERSECGGRVPSDIDVASMRTVRADGERRRPFLSFCSMAGGDCQQLALTPDFTPHDPLYGSSLAYELCTIVRNSKSHDSCSGRSSKTEGKGADNSRGSAGADPRRVLSLELGDRVRLGTYGIRCH
jgi:hypothetical protein